jgi:transposase
MQNQEVASSLCVHTMTVGKWRQRFLEHRLDGLHDGPRSGAPRTIDDARIEAVVVRTPESQPEGATHWSSRGMARASGILVSSVQRIWRAFGSQPHRHETAIARHIGSVQRACMVSEQSLEPSLPITERHLHEVLAIEVEQIEGEEGQKGGLAIIGDSLQQAE